jgi:hypothetical protein
MPHKRFHREIANVLSHAYYMSSQLHLHSLGSQYSNIKSVTKYKFQRCEASPFSVTVALLFQNTVRDPANKTFITRNLKHPNKYFKWGNIFCVQSPLLFGRGGEAVREEKGNSREGCGASNLGGGKKKPCSNQSCTIAQCVNSKHVLMARDKNTGYLNSPDSTRFEPLYKNPDLQGGGYNNYEHWFVIAIRSSPAYSLFRRRNERAS